MEDTTIYNDIETYRVDIPETYKIITLCGSTKFKYSFEKLNCILTLNNKIIIQPGCFMHHDKINITNEQKINLDVLHKEKIKMSDCIFVVNYNNYIGDSTKSEIEYTNELNKPVYYMFDCNTKLNDKLFC